MSLCLRFLYIVIALHQSCAFTPFYRLSAASSSLNMMNKNNQDPPSSSGENNPSRRLFMDSFAAASFGLISFVGSHANARGLVRFPCNDYEFLNKYHFMRAGESLLEEEGVWSTNPLFLTNREAALSERGAEQVTELCKKLKADRVAPTIVRYSLAANAIDSANIVGRELKVGRDRLVPEFNFMDPRAIGSWDMSAFDKTKYAVWALDNDEAGVDGKEGRPPSNDDGTPHETLADQVVRLQQLISVLETQYSGDTILLIFPDGVGPALLTCLIGGVPLNRVHELEYEPGEVRLNINYESSKRYADREPSEEYINALAVGRKQLKSLRNNPDQLLNIKDQKFEEELRAEEARRAKVEQEMILKNEQDAQYRKTLQAKNPEAVVKFDSKTLALISATVVGGAWAASLFSVDDEKSNDATTVQNELTDTEPEPLDLIMENSNASTSNTPSDDQLANAENETPLVLTKKNTAWDPDEDDGGLAWIGSLEDMLSTDGDYSPQGDNSSESSWQ